jgi:hypothetical protein
MLCVVVALGATLPCLAQTPESFEVRRAEAVFEELPELKASEILKPEFSRNRIMWYAMRFRLRPA